MLTNVECICLGRNIRNVESRNRVIGNRALGKFSGGGALRVGAQVAGDAAAHRW